MIYFNLIINYHYLNLNFLYIMNQCCLKWFNRFNFIMHYLIVSNILIIISRLILQILFYFFLFYHLEYFIY